MTKSAIRQSLSRAPLMLLALLSLLIALWAGLIRMGWGWPILQPTLLMAHGPLMVSGFLGTLISLERAVALELRWPYAAPLLTGTGAIILASGISGWLGPLLITLGSVLMVIIVLQILRIHITLYTGVILIGSGCWLIGNLFWVSGQPVAHVIAWWIGFPLLTVAGERLELGRLLRLSTKTTASFIASIILFVAGAAISTVQYTRGVQITGVAMVLMAAWLLRYDIASRRIKAGGQARFIAISLLSGYGWLAFGGILTVLYAGLTAGPIYDAMLHTIFLGFTFTMIFAHAPIIFPAVLARSFHYTPRFYSHLILLHVTLALRITGDLLFWGPGRLWGGLLNAVVLILFLSNTLASIRK